MKSIKGVFISFLNLSLLNFYIQFIFHQWHFSDILHLFLIYSDLLRLFLFYISEIKLLLLSLAFRVKFDDNCLEKDQPNSKGDKQ